MYEKYNFRNIFLTCFSASNETNKPRPRSTKDSSKSKIEGSKSSSVAPLSAPSAPAIARPAGGLAGSPPVHVTPGSSGPVTVEGRNSKNIERRGRVRMDSGEDLAKNVFVIDIYTRFDSIFPGKNIKWKRVHESLDKGLNRVYRKDVAPSCLAVSQATPAYKPSESVTGAYFEITVTSLRTGYVRG
jgi:hypothetical protein